MTGGVFRFVIISRSSAAVFASEAEGATLANFHKIGKMAKSVRVERNLNGLQPGEYDEL